MSDPIILLFSGQGAQKVGMAKDVYEDFEEARALMDGALDALGNDLLEVMFEGPMEKLTRTSFCQPALYLHGMAALEVLKTRVEGFEKRVVAAAGLSLGEFSAHAAAGTFEVEVGLKVVQQRGQFMEEACEATKGAMAAMIGGEPEQVEALAKAVDVDVANYNAPGQIVLSGSEEGVQAAIQKERCKEYGIRMGKALPVAGAYHSRLMESAAAKLAGVLEEAELSEPRFPVVSNVRAEAIAEPAEIKQVLVEQVTGSVRWTESMQGLIAKFPGATFLELGPGGTLAGLMGRTDKSIAVKGAATSEELRALFAEL